MVESQEVQTNDDLTLKMQEDKNTATEKMIEPVVSEVTKVLIISHNSKLNPSEVINNHPLHDIGGLKGNPGQLARFNHVMENKSGEVHKYFGSGRKN